MTVDLDATRSLPTLLVFYYYLRQGGNVFARVRPCVCLISSGFTKPCRNMDYGHGKTPLNFGIDPAQSGQMTAILDIAYKLYGTTGHLANFSSKCWAIAGLGGGMCSSGAY